MALVKIPSNLHILVKEKYKAACKTGSVIFSDTNLSLVRANNLPFQLRYCPALSQKPKSAPSDAPTKPKPVDPFDNPPADLLITELPTSHLLVLNKYPVIPGHFILATKEFKEQTHLLEEEDVSAAFACVKAWKALGKELFGFFNSGEHSGASQPHRHMQFVAVEEMRGGKERDGWEVLADALLTDSRLETLPFAAFSAELSDDPSPSTLYDLYKDLHRKAVSVVESYVSENPGTNITLHDTQNGSSAISYNLGITHKSMVLCPRRKERGRRDKSSDETLEQPALNGTILAGTLMVKSQEAYDSMRQHPEQLVEVLKDIGFPPSSELRKKL